MTDGPRYRNGQLWTDPERQRGFWVRNLEPLELSGWGIAEVRPSREELHSLTQAELSERFPHLRHQPEADPTEIKAGLTGRTITDVQVEAIDGPWPQGDGDITLTLDDGNTVRISSWGYDAFGTSVYFERLPDLAGQLPN